MSQGTEMKSWWNEGDMELENRDLKREQIVQLPLTSLGYCCAGKYAICVFIL